MDSSRLSEIAASMHTETILAYISAIDIVISNTSTRFNLSTLHSQQQELAQYLFPKEIADRITSFIQRGERDTYIHDEQLLLAAKFAIAHGQPGPAEQPPSLHFLGEFLLGINDVLQGEEKVPESLSELELQLILKRQGLHRNEQIRYLLPRYFDLLVTRPSSEPKEGRTLDEAFRLETGVGIEEYLSFAFLYLAPFFSVADIETLQKIDYLSVIRRYEEQIRDIQMRERCRQFFSKNRASLRKTYRGKDLRRSSNVPFKKFPLIRMENGSALPISLSLLAEKVTMGTYWILYNHFMELYPHDIERGMNEFTTYLGKLFQDYASQLLSRMCNVPDHQEEHFYDENAIRLISKKAGEGKPDGIIITKNCMVIMEMTTASVRATVLENGDVNGFREDTKKFVKKMQQLSNAFDNIARDRVVIPGLQKGKISNVYQVLVLLHPFPQCHEAWRLLREPVNQEAVEQPDLKPPYPQPYEWYPFGASIVTTKVHQPQILTIEELEMLEPLLRGGKYSLPDLLHEKLRTPRTANISMKNFLLRYLNIEDQPNESMMALFNTVTAKIRENLILHVEFAEHQNS